MKVQFKYGIKTYSGTLDDMTYGSYRKNTVCIGRKHVIPRITEHNTELGATMKNLGEVYSSVTSGYKDDLKVYSQRNAINISKGKLVPSSFAVWIQMMFLFSELDEGHIDLATVTYSDLETLGADIASIATAIENGYLADVPDSDELTAEM